MHSFQKLANNIVKYSAHDKITIVDKIGMIPCTEPKPSPAIT